MLLKNENLNRNFLFDVLNKNGNACHPLNFLPQETNHRFKSYQPLLLIFSQEPHFTEILPKVLQSSYRNHVCINLLSNPSNLGSWYMRLLNCFLNDSRVRLLKLLLVLRSAFHSPTYKAIKKQFCRMGLYRELFLMALSRHIIHIRFNATSWKNSWRVKRKAWHKGGGTKRERGKDAQTGWKLLSFYFYDSLPFIVHPT